ncbi:MAG TPA: ABC transporter substrate-binding protein [Chloroflexota bacterium]|jgi:ABC-type nitrate/sulfonate/bicarbonate transport system substrate-binding protein|nr:ABC transporter substrate-binding protein [Chloroflexota bacterium]
MSSRFLFAGCLGLSLLLAACAQGASPSPSAGSAPTAGSASTTAASPPPAAREPVTLRYGPVTFTAMFWPLYVGERQGWFTEEGVNLEVNMFRISSDATRALSADSIDIAGTAFDSAVLAVEGGADVVAVSGILNKPLYNLIVRPEFRAVADLRGKTLGVSDLKDGSTILLQRALDREGLHPGEYDLVQAGGTPERYAAVKSGAVAGAMISQPNDFVAMAEGYPSLLLVSDIIPDYQFTANVVRRSWAQRNEEALARFHRVWVRACRWLYDPANKTEAIRILAERLNTPEDLARKTYELYFEHADALPRNGELNLAGVRTVLDIMTEMGNLPSPTPSAERYIDTSYLERATRR